MRRPTARHRLEHHLFRIFTGLVRRLPRRSAEAFGGAAGVVAGSLLRIRRAEVERHLRMAFSERDDRWRRAVARRSYRHLGREGVAMVRLASMDAEEVRRRTRVPDMAALREALERGRGAVVVTGHLGNWEVGGAALAARGVALDAVALRQGNPLFDRELVRTRERLGMRVIQKRNAPAEALRSLREGRAVALLGDHNPISGGVDVEFFGRPANTPRGPATLALRSGAPLFLGVAARASGDEPGYRIELEAVSVERTGETGRDVRALVQAYTARLEEAVRRIPGQYFWQHRRW